LILAIGEADVRRDVLVEEIDGQRPATGERKVVRLARDHARRAERGAVDLDAPSSDPACRYSSHLLEAVETMSTDAAETTSTR